MILLRWLLLAGCVLLGCGCVFPWYAHTYQDWGDKRIEAHALNFLTPGLTTKEDVLLRLGAPIPPSDPLVWLDEMGAIYLERFTYSLGSDEDELIFFLPVGMGANLPLGRATRWGQKILEIEFNDLGVVTRWEITLATWKYRWPR